MVRCIEVAYNGLVVFSFRERGEEFRQEICLLTGTVGSQQVLEMRRSVSESLQHPLDVVKSQDEVGVYVSRSPPAPACPPVSSQRYTPDLHRAGNVNETAICAQGATCHTTPKPSIRFLSALKS